MPKPPIAVERAMLAILEHGMRYPRIWHRIGTDTIYRRAAELLVKRGAIEINQVTDQYRILKK